MAHPAQKLLAKISLNLLYPQGIPEKLPLHLLKWLLSYGRFIAVAVEILVLATFAARFKLDADLADVRQKIQQQTPYIQALSLDEGIIKQTQLRLTAIKQAYSADPQWVKVLTELSSQMPSHVQLSSLSLDHPENQNNLEFKLTAQATSSNDLSYFLSTLNTDKKFRDISLTNITVDQGNITFSITGLVN